MGFYFWNFILNIYTNLRLPNGIKVQPRATIVPRNALAQILFKFLQALCCESLLLHEGGECTLDEVLNLRLLAPREARLRIRGIEAAITDEILNKLLLQVVAMLDNILLPHLLHGLHGVSRWPCVHRLRHVALVLLFRVH